MGVTKTSHQPYKVGMISSTLQAKKLRLRDVQYLSKDTKQSRMLS